MRRVLIVISILLLLITTNLFAQDTDSTKAVPDTISWYTDFDEALKAASEEGRYILVEFYTDW